VPLGVVVPFPPAHAIVSAANTKRPIVTFAAGSFAAIDFHTSHWGR
jgi:hypothetical protein